VTTTYTETFTTADSSTAAPNFMNRLNVYGMSSNAAYPVTGNTQSGATYNTVSGSDDMIVSITTLAVVGGFLPPVGVHHTL
jgi:hypothetical protein